MPVFCHRDDEFYFPSVDKADEEGLLIIGGRVTGARVMEAYTRGIFPWYNADELPLWWSPDPRFVLFPDELHISRSMAKIISGNLFSFTMNTAFREVISACATVERQGQHGTWLTGEMRQTYTALHMAGNACSAEAWQEGDLVGGLYGISIGRVFYGESMFSKKNNASKFVFIRLVQHLRQCGMQLIDCQVYTPHVESLGARLISRSDFLQYLKEWTNS